MTGSEINRWPAGQHDEHPVAVSPPPGAPARRTRRRFGWAGRATLLGLAVVIAGFGLAACQPQEPVTGVYSVNVNGSAGELTVRQSGSGATAAFTATVSSPFKPTGFTCSLTSGTVVASFTGSGPSFTATYAKFDPTTCAKLDDGYGANYGAVATLNDDKTLTLGLPSSGTYAVTALLVRTGDGTNLPNPVAGGEYSVDVNGSAGALTVRQSGSGDAAIFTATVSSPFEPTGFSCSLTSGTVVASFTGAGPSFTPSYAKFDKTTCAKLDDGYGANYGAVARLNIDNTMVLGLPSSGTYAKAALLVRTGKGTTVANPVVPGTYAVDLNGSAGALTVRQSGSGDAAIFTATVSSPFEPTGFSCSLTSGTVVASFTGAGPSFTATYAKFDKTTCAKLGDGYGANYGAVARLNIDNTLVLGLPSSGTYAKAALLYGRT